MEMRASAANRSCWVWMSLCRTSPVSMQRHILTLLFTHIDANIVYGGCLPCGRR
jgi:hypothetical protein